MIITADESNKRSAIIDNLDKNMLVEAGAGAGKTTLVVKRNIEQIKKGTLTASELVDITFTKAAAEELRNRLLNGLHEEANNPSISVEEKERIEKAIKDESLIQISTIHSFCKRLLTEQTFAARLPMDVKLLDNVDAKKRKTDFFNDWYSRQDTAELKKIDREFYRGGASKYIFHTFMNICELSDDTDIIYNTALVQPNAKKTADYFADMHAKLNDSFRYLTRVAIDRLAPTKLSTFDDIRGAVLTDYCKAYDRLSSISSKKEFVDIYKPCQDKWLSKKGFSSKSINKALGIPNTEVDVLDSNFAALMGNENPLDELEAYQSVLIIDMAMQARKEYRAYCKRPENRHEITNDLLLQEALELVKNSSEARKYFQSKFSCIYVDEFQDTDLVQRDLIEILCQDPDDLTKRREGVFFFVGDPKQSIYAFRGADVDVYEDTKEKYDNASITDVEEYILDNNYRSEKLIVDWVNSNFKLQFDSILTTPYSDMNAFRDNADQPGVLCGVYKIKFPNWYSDKNAALKSRDWYPRMGEAKERESRMIASIIRHLVDDGLKIWERKDGITNPKNIEYRDFLILCQKKKDINRYANILKKAGIPINLYGALDNENEDIIIRVMQLYKALTYKYDQQAVYGAMEVLIGERIEKNNEAEARSKYELLYDITKEMNGFELLQYLSHHPEYILVNEVNGEEATRAQSRLQQMLEDIQSKPVSDRQDVLRKINRYIESEVDKELSLESEANAIRFMNLHKAKGLEGKIVIICARGKRRDSISEYRSMKEYYPIAAGDKNSYMPGLRSFACDPRINYLAERHMREERVRQDYVEATRAKEVLIFMDALESGCIFDEYDFSTAKSLLDVSEGIDNDINDIIADKYGTYQSNNTTTDYNLSAWDPDGTAEQKIRLEQSITPSGMEHNDKASWNPGQEATRPYGNIFGIVMHRCFELLVKSLRTNATFEVLNIINQAIMESYSDIIADYSDEEDREKEIQLYKDYLEGRLKAFLSDSNLPDEIISAKAVYTEMSFSQYADRNYICNTNKSLDDAIKTAYRLDEDVPYWVNGQADIVIVDNDDNVHIVDYKSDHLGGATIPELEAHLKAAYDNQQELYRYAISHALNIPMDKIYYSYYHMYM